MSARPSLVLGVHAMSRGFGWIAYDGPFAPYDWRVVEVRRDKNATSIRRLAKLLSRLQPDTLVLEHFEPDGSVRHARIAKLYRALSVLAQDAGIDVAVFSRSDVQACFAHVGAKTRFEIAEAVARHTPHLRSRLPSKRRTWESEDVRMALFSAAALVVTHYALDARRFLDGLSTESS